MMEYIFYSFTLGVYAPLQYSSFLCYYTPSYILISNFFPGQESSKETIQQIVKALNIVLLKLAAEAPSGLVLGALIQALFLCIPGNEVDHVSVSNV